MGFVEMFRPRFWTRIRDHGCLYLAATFDLAFVQRFGGRQPAKHPLSHLAVRNLGHERQVVKQVADNLVNDGDIWLAPKVEVVINRTVEQFLFFCLNV